ILLELNREQNHLKMNLYKSHTGDFIRTILEEKSKTYVEPLHPLLFSKTESGTFFYQSRKDGYNHIYKCSIDGSFMKQLTHGNWEVTNLLGLDSKEQYMYLESTQESPLERHIYRFDLKNGQSVRLTNGEGIHNGLLSPNKDALLDKFQGPAIPNRITLIDTRNKKECMILNAENPLKDYLLGETRLVTIKSADGKTDLYAKMILPPNFDPKKKYPVIVYVYGGPHSQLVDKSWLYNGMFWQYYMADRGYIAFTLDNRGTSFRGSDFENVIHRQLGINETADQMQGVEYLKSLPYVDSTRIGVHGWSFGGFMTLNLILRHSETFKVGVAGGPVVDWKMYEIMYGERYMDMPQENPEGYKESNMILKVDNLKGKLLLLHGMQDETVVMQQNIRFMQECIKKGKLVDFFPYPTHEHNVKGIDRVHLMDLVSHYFEEHL
ncbi:MAG: prolyl oligopeptidase family serine peptidase, partial [Bacteroidota bacterium]|nr:prolyl oligopeptidase family serine peptidase [Bacteroidota bacterium]